MSATGIGALDGEKQTWIPAARVGIIGHDHIFVSLVYAHFN